MESFEFSAHARLKMSVRNIPKELVINVIQSPQQTMQQADGEMVFQSVVRFPNGKDYLLRVFVNIIVKPNKIITIYDTNKIKKYSI